MSILRLKENNSIAKDQWSFAYDQMDTYDLSKVMFFHKTPESGLLDDYREAIKSRYGYNVARQAVILEPKIFPFEERSKYLTSPFIVFMFSFYSFNFLSVFSKKITEDWGLKKRLF